MLYRVVRDLMIPINFVYLCICFVASIFRYEIVTYIIPISFIFVDFNCHYLPLAPNLCFKFYNVIRSLYIVVI